MKTPDESKCGMECIRTNVKRICVKPEKGQCPRCEQLVSEALARIRQLESRLAEAEEERDRLMRVDAARVANIQLLESRLAQTEKDLAFKEKCLEWRYNDIARAEDMIDDLNAKLAQAERERDAAVRDMHKAVVCDACKHDRPFNSNCKNDFDCEYCKSPCMCQSCHLGSNYEWRGVCAENTEEES